MGLSSFMFNIKFINRSTKEVFYDGTDILEGNYIASKYVAITGTSEAIDVIYRGYLYTYREWLMGSKGVDING